MGRIANFIYVYLGVCDRYLGIYPGFRDIDILFIALGYLYSGISLNLIRPDNSRAVLAAGCLFGGMEDLCKYAYETCRQSITVDTIGGWVEFIDSVPSSGDGSTTPESPKTSIFGLYAQRLKDDVYHFLVDTLPEILEVRQSSPESTSPGPSGRDILLQIYSRVPFEMFKTAVESPNFRPGMTLSTTCPHVVCLPVFCLRSYRF